MSGITPSRTAVSAATSSLIPRLCFSPPLRIAVLGCGVVGRAFLRAAAPHTLTRSLRVVAVTDRGGTVVDPGGLDPLAVADTKEHGRLALLPVTHRPWDALAAATLVDADLIVNLTPSRLEPHAAKDEPLVAALAAGRDVVTAAKAALALFPTEVANLQAAHGGRLRCSAAVAGSVPLIETLRGALRGAGIRSIEGAWNAASSFVLSRIEAGLGLDEALNEARLGGYVEEDTRADFDGRDAAAKAAIVARIAFGTPLSLVDVDSEGLGADAFCRAQELRCRGLHIRLVARVTPDGASVRPVALPVGHPLATTGGEAAVIIRTVLAGDLVLRGPGAGGAATASAVLSDVLGLAAERRRQTC